MDSRVTCQLYYPLYTDGVLTCQLIYSLYADSKVISAVLSLAHGKCSYSVDGNIITINAIGPWNLEFFMQMHLELADIILTRVDISNFAILLILQGDSLAAQDGLDYHLKLVRAGPTKAIAINSAMSNSPQITQSIFKKRYDQAGLKNSVLDCTQAAKAWLATQLNKEH